VKNKDLIKAEFDEGTIQSLDRLRVETTLLKANFDRESIYYRAFRSIEIALNQIKQELLREQNDGNK